MRCLIFLGETIEGDRSIAAALRYVKDSDKTSYGRYVEAIHCSKENTLASMELIKKLHRNHGDREYKHFVQSFAPGEKVSPEQVLELGKRTASFFEGHACLVAYHGNTLCPHYHCVISNINLYTKNKLSISPSMFRDFWEHSISVYESMDLPQGVSSPRMKRWMKFLKKSMLSSGKHEEWLEMPEDIIFYPDMLDEPVAEYFDDWYIDGIYDWADADDDCYTDDTQLIKPIVYLPQHQKLIQPIEYVGKNEPSLIKPIEYIDIGTDTQWYSTKRIKVQENLEHWNKI